jgi:hypothetical protein
VHSDQAEAAILKANVFDGKMIEIPTLTQTVMIDPSPPERHVAYDMVWLQNSSQRAVYQVQ